MLRRLFSIGTLGTAGLVAVGVLSLQGGTALADEDVVKRDEDTPDLVLVADDDDDDTFADDDTGDTRTGISRNTGDNTNSRSTRVSRDRDLSRGDKTRDWTKDGAGKVKRDWSANTTNDRSRNDTRR